MFGIGFGEITVVLIVALLVWGPKEIKTLIYQAQKWLQKLQRYRQQWHQTKQHVFDELTLEELKEKRFNEVMKTAPPKTPHKTPTKNTHNPHD